MCPPSSSSSPTNCSCNTFGNKNVLKTIRGCLINWFWVFIIWRPVRSTHMTMCIQTSMRRDNTTNTTGIMVKFANVWCTTTNWPRAKCNIMSITQTLRWLSWRKQFHFICLIICMAGALGAMMVIPKWITLLSESRSWTRQGNRVQNLNCKQVGFLEESDSVSNAWLFTWQGHGEQWW